MQDPAAGAGQDFMPADACAEAQAAAVIDRVFAIGSTARWLERSTPYFWHKHLAVRQVTCPPRISVWVHLLQAAGLLSRGLVPQPTRFLEDWLAQPVAVQLQDLLVAWVHLPARVEVRRSRQRILDCLVSSGPDALSARQRRVAQSLGMLGLWQADHLTPLGQQLLQTRRPFSTSEAPVQPWQIGAGSLQLPPHPDRALVWRLERFLYPYAPGRYLLNGPALRQAAQRGPLEELVLILEIGQERALTAELSAQILRQPLTHARRGWVLSFDQPQELAHLRQSAALRKHLDGILGPGQVFVAEARIEPVLTALHRRGLPVIAPGTPERESSIVETAAPLSTGELAELYAVALAAERAGLGVTASTETTRRLASLLPEPLRQRTARAVRKMLPASATARQAYPEREPPGPVPIERVERLQRAADHGESVHGWYRASGEHAPERRRLSPLLVEQRGAYLYVIAYCHARRANRTFRLDRLWLEEEADG